MFGLYKRSLDDANGLTTLLAMVLLDESVYKAQRNALIEFAKQSPAKNAHELALQTHTAMCELAARMWKDGKVPLGMPGFLWKAKHEDIEPR